MGTFGSSLWGSGGGAGTVGAAGLPISSLINPAYRIAGITQWVGIVPSNDMYVEAIGALNALLEITNCDGHKIFTTSIATYPLNAGQKLYSIGPGGDFDAPRPLYIRGANALFPTTPVVRRHVDILDDDQWRSITVQDIVGAPPYQLYYDGGFDSNGRGQIYLRFQPPAGYSLELYTWQALSSSFTSSTDVAYLPPGYQLFLTYNLAKQLATLNPNMANMSPRAYEIADSSMMTLIALNSHSPRIACEPGLSGEEFGPGYGWLDGGIQ